MNPRTRFLVIFAVAIMGLYLFIAAPPVNDSLVIPFTRGIALVTGSILRVLGQSIEVVGLQVRGPGAAVEIQNGCNGLEAIVVLTAAVLAFPATWKSRALAIGVGCLLLQLLNLVRTTSLYLILAHKPSWFEILHTGVWQTLLVIAAVGFFLAWSVKQRPRDA